MTRNFEAYDLQTAPAEARALLEQNQKKFGAIPPPLARYAVSPLALETALAGLAAFERSSLAPLEREVLAMVMGRKNGCEFCLRLHRRLLGFMDAPPGLADALERGEPLGNPRLEAVRSFVLAVIASAGDVNAREWQAFLAAGFDHAAALEIVVGIATYTLTTFANRLVETPLM